MNLTRRTLLANASLATLPLPRLHAAPPATLAHPTPQQQTWQDLEFGMFVHFAPNTWQDVESDNLSTPLDQINPVKLDTDQWARTAVAMGARYLVFVAKHQGGFCMWQTHTTDYGIRNTPWRDGKGDVMADVVASCKKFGLKLGVYVCPRDDFHHIGTGGIAKTPELQAEYDKLYRAQLTEILSRYGTLCEVWFDGNIKTPVGDLLAKYQRNAMIFQGPQATIRWVGTEEGSAPYPCWNSVDPSIGHSGSATALDSDPNATFWLPSEVDVSIRRPNWFWSTKNADKVLTLDQLLSIYYRSIGRGAQLLLNLPANRDGLLDAPDVAVTAALGKEIARRFAKPIAASKTATLTFPRPTQVDTVLLAENIALGERIRAYRLEGKSKGAWKTIAEGTAIGHKRIQPIEPQSLSAIRLVVTESAAPPSLRSLAAFDTATPPPADWNATSRLWSSNLAGKWADGRFSLDLTKLIKVAGQYILRFQPQPGPITRIHDFVLEQGDVSTPTLIKAAPTHVNLLYLNITGLDRSIMVTGQVDGAPTGQILLERR